MAAVVWFPKEKNKNLRRHVNHGGAVATRDGEMPQLCVFYAPNCMEDLFTIFVCHLLYITAQ